MRRSLAGILLLGHGMAHTIPGMRATEGVSQWITAAPLVQTELIRFGFTALWATAVTALLAAGFGILETAPFRKYWRLLALLGAGASLLLLSAGWHHRLAAVGVLLDLAIVWAAVHAPVPAPIVGRQRFRSAVAIAIVASIGGLILIRPWYVVWGSTGEELLADLPGDELVPGPSYQIQHAISIPAPADRVWPWLVQLGEGRGGFYSYDRLQNLFGLDIHSADRIQPAWQRLEAGDSVFATHLGWLGLKRRLGWEVARVVPGRALVLKGWGAFVLQPIDSTHTRLIVRSRGGGPDNLVTLVMGPAGLLGFEPAHFIMQRRMLSGIRGRALSGGAGAG